MKAIAIIPGRPETAGSINLPEPPKSDGSVLVRTRSIGLCGTDLEIALDGYGVPPPGQERLVHRSRTSRAPRCTVSTSTGSRDPSWIWSTREQSPR